MNVFLCHFAELSFILSKTCFSARKILYFFFNESMKMIHFHENNDTFSKTNSFNPLLNYKMKHKTVQQFK